MCSRIADYCRLVLACCRGKGNMRDRKLAKKIPTRLLAALCMSSVYPRYCVGSTETYCQGLFVRCGDTRSQLPRRGLYRRCDISFRIASGIVEFSKRSLTSEQWRGHCGWTIRAFGIIALRARGSQRLS